MPHILLALPDEVIDKIDALSAKRRSENRKPILLPPTQEQLEKAKSMCDRDSNSKRANAYLAACQQVEHISDKQVNLSRHAICKEMLLIGFDSVFSEKPDSKKL